MKHCIARTAAIVLFAVAAPSLLQAAGWIDQRRVSPTRGDAEAGAAKATTCLACHGPNGNAVIPLFPRLAGQHVDYLAGELHKVKLGNRPDSPMTPLVAPLSEQDILDLSAYFAAQKPTPSTLPPADAAVVSRGEALYLHGDPQRGAPPCQGCHGADATGPAGTAQHLRAWPALRTQNSDYVVQRLQAYRDGKLKDSSNDFIMHGVAQSLDDDAIHAIAAWLASLPPEAP